MTGASFSLSLESIAEAPDCPAVFLIWLNEGAPYLGKTAALRRRLQRLLKERDKPSRLLNLRQAFTRAECWITGSALESSLRMYQLARRHFPKTYLDLLRLRLPPYVKIVLDDPFPRSQITTASTGRRHSTSDRSDRASQRKGSNRVPGPLSDAPLPGRSGDFARASRLHLRRDGDVSPPLPGSGRRAEYAHEVERVVEFLRSDGRSLVTAIEHSRDRLSQEMKFEEAARQHKRLEKVLDVLKLRDELARDIDRLHGVAITRSLAADAVEMWFLRGGNWHMRQRFSFEVQEGMAVSLDRELRDTFAALEPVKLTVRERQEYLALLARWYYSSWRDGEWVGFESFEDVPFRRLVLVTSRVARK